MNIVGSYSKSPQAKTKQGRAEENEARERP